MTDEFISKVSHGLSKAIDEALFSILSESGIKPPYSAEKLLRNKITISGGVVIKDGVCIGRIDYDMRFEGKGVSFEVKYIVFKTKVTKTKL